MNATERAALLQGVALHDELTGAIDERTFEILEKRRRTAVVRRRGWLVRRALLLADMVGLSLAFLLAAALWESETSFDKVALPTETTLFLATLPGWIVVAKLYGLYDRDEFRGNHTTVDDLVAVFHLVTVGSWLFLASAWLTDLAHPAFPKLLTFWLLGIGFVTAARVAARSVYRRNLTYLQNTVIVGAGDVGQLVARKLLHHPEYGINLLGFVDSSPKEWSEDLEHLTLLGPLERLPAIVRLFDVERVVVAFSNDSHERTIELIHSLKDLEIQVDIVPRLFDLVSPSAEIHTVEGIPLVGLPPLRLSRSSRFLKRAADLAVAVVSIVLLAPLFALIAWRIKAASPGPVFFRQVRMGSGGNTFRIYKFRTMVDGADERKADFSHLNRHGENGGDGRMFKIPSDPRVTRLGAFLRRHSLDELPQLINVVKGEMSLVGPRPLILDEDRHVEAWARKRINIKPGMTGLWQVLGRSEIPFEEMVKLDYLYVTTWSLWNDCRLLFRTFPLVLKGQRGSY
jgi:exopolysaccharide biosynthesis polyprenyl glycosylphosphotransferase